MATFKHRTERGDQPRDIQIGGSLNHGSALERRNFAPLSTIEREYILKVYEALNRNKTQTARVLEVDVKTLYNKLKRYGIHP